MSRWRRNLGEGGRAGWWQPPVSPRGAPPSPAITPRVGDPRPFSRRGAPSRCPEPRCEDGARCFPEGALREAAGQEMAVGFTSPPPPFFFFSSPFPDSCVQPTYECLCTSLGLYFFLLPFYFFSSFLPRSPPTSPPEIFHIPAILLQRFVS